MVNAVRLKLFFQLEIKRHLFSRIRIIIMHDVPFLKLLFWMIAGIWISTFFPMNYKGYLYLLSLIFLFIYVIRSKNDKTSAWIFNVSFALITFSLLFLRMDYLDPLHKGNFIGNQPAEIKMQGKVLSSKKRLNGGWRYVLDVSHTFNRHNQADKASGLLLLYVSQSSMKPFLPGAIIQGRLNRLLPIPGAENPGAFDQREFWAVKRIYFKAYAVADEWKEFKKPSGSLFYREKTQEYISDIFKKTLKDSLSLGLMEALLIGKKTSLSPEIMTDFRRTGAVHILAVSGLHVGILAGIIQFCLGLFPLYYKTGKIISAVFFISFLLSFAWLTHFEPAIVRAVGGTIIMILAKSFQKTANAWNNLFAMACFLLFWDPNHLFHIGFQLSFIAVAGILAFYKSWVNRLQFKSRIITYFWEMSVMGFAAQWVTLPLLLFHFKQFSWLFLITGWVAIPVSTFILGVGLLYLSISCLPVVNYFIGWILEFSIYIFRGVMSFLSHFSWAVTEGIYLNFLAVFLLIILVLSLAFAIEYRKRNVWVISICVLVSLFHFSAVYSNATMNAAHILSERRNATLAIRKGHSFYVFSIYPLDQHRQDLLYLGRWARDIHYLKIPEKTGSFRFQNQELIILKSDVNENFLPFGTHWWIVDAINMDWEFCFSTCPPNVLILNANLPVSYKIKQAALAEKYGIKVFDIYKSGAYTLNE